MSLTNPDALCGLPKTVSASFTLDGRKTYEGADATELDPLGHALRMKRPDRGVGADVRDGVCCADIEMYEDGKGKAYRVVHIHLARGATVVNSLAEIDCEWPKGKESERKVAVTATLVRP